MDTICFQVVDKHALIVVTMLPLTQGRQREIQSKLKKIEGKRSQKRVVSIVKDIGTLKEKETSYAADEYDFWTLAIKYITAEEKKHLMLKYKRGKK